MALNTKRTDRASLQNEKTPGASTCTSTSIELPPNEVQLQ